MRKTIYIFLACVIAMASAFGAADTWSQKYNLVWDRILGLGVFPEDIVRAELDYRSTYTMSDWFYTDIPNYCSFIARSVVGGYFIQML